MSSKSTNDRGFAATARERAIEAYDDARESAGEAGRKAGEQIGEAPLLALAGGLAAGALLAALLPKSKVEQKLTGPLGAKLTDGAKAAVGAAKDAGTAKLAELDITRDAGSKLVQSVIKGIGEAAKAGGQAAVETARRKD